MNYINSDFTQFTATLVEDMTSRMHSAYCREEGLEDYQRVMDAITPTGYASTYNHLKKTLVDNLRKCGYQCGRTTSLDELNKMVHQLPDRETLASELYGELYENFRQFPTAADFMQRLVRRLADPDLVCDSVRLTIVKQFCRHTNYGTLIVKKLTAALRKQDLGLESPPDLSKEDVLRYADERIFEILKMPMDRDAAHKFKLLRLADDLAGGKFRTGGKTKNDLYMFAFAFGMTVFTGEPGTQPDEARDLEKNLFRDFYCDNLLRYATDDFLDNAAAFEQEPTGEGINYKNFAEVIYLYYLNRKDMNPRKRLTTASNKIDECVSIIRTRRSGLADPGPDSGERRYTSYYQNQFLQKVCALGEDELTSFICANYQFPEDLDLIANITAESQRRSAALVYEQLLEQVLELTTSEDLSDVNYDLDLDRAMAPYEDDEQFTALIERLNQMLRIRWCTLPITATPAAEKITRTHLMALLVHQYRLLGWAKGMNLPRLLKNFRNMADPLLVQARFQPVCEKNIFDMFAIMAIYYLENHTAPLE